MERCRCFSHVALIGLVLMFVCAVGVGAAGSDSQSVDVRMAQLEARVAELEERLASLESLLDQLIQKEAGESAEPPQAADPQETPAAPPDSSWKPMNQNWEYRNASLRRGGFFDTFIIELRRVGPPITSGMMTVTLYDDEERIVSTGRASVITMATGDIRTVEFWLDSNPENARVWRLQVDFEH